MKDYALGVNLGAVSGVSAIDAIALVASAGFDSCFLDWSPTVDVEACAENIARSGLIFQSIHGPFRKVETLWEEGDEGDAYVGVMLECLRDCARFDVPVMIVHPIKGMDKHMPNELGLSRFARLIEEAEKTKGPKLVRKGVGTQ